MLILKKVAITGGLSSGKSTVCEIFQKKGAYCVSADAIVHDLLTLDTTTGKAIIDLLGEDIVECGALNRAKIAKQVFENQPLLKALEAILHPAVLEEIERQYRQVPETYTLFIAEIPLLYEIEKDHLFDTVITVTTDEKLAKERFKEKTEQTDTEYEQRMTHQLPPSEKIARADHTLTNNGNIADLENQIDTLYQKLTQE